MLKNRLTKKISEQSQITKIAYIIALIIAVLIGAIAVLIVSHGSLSSASGEGSLGFIILLGAMFLFLFGFLPTYIIGFIVDWRAKKVSYLQLLLGAIVVIISVYYIVSLSLPAPEYVL